MMEVKANEQLTYYGDKMCIRDRYTTVIPRNVRLAEAPSHGMPVIQYDPKSAGAIAYMEFADEFLANEEEI